MHYPTLQYPISIQQDVATLEQFYGVHSGTILAALISAVCTAAQNNVRVLNPIDNKESGIHEYVAVVAASGCKKSTIINAMLDPVMRFEQTYNQEVTASQPHTDQEKRIWNAKRRALEVRLSKAIESGHDDDVPLCVKRLEEHESTRPISQQLRHYIQNGLTRAGMARVLNNADVQPLFYLQEGIELTDKLNHELISMLNAGWSNEPIHIAKQHHDICIEQPHFSLLIAIQPKLFMRHFTSDDTLSLSGFWGRVLIFRPYAPSYVEYKSEFGAQTLKGRCEQVPDVRSLAPLGIRDKVQHESSAHLRG